MPQARTVPNRLSGLVLSAFLLAFGSFAASVSAQTPAEDLRQLRARFESLESQTGLNFKAEQSFVDDLDNLVNRLRGAEASPQVARGLRELIEAANRRYEGSLKRERDAIIAADGDLEAAQEDPGWQLREELGLRTRYHLNWAYLEAATRYEPRSSRRSEWLRSAAEGFGEFIGVQGDAALAAESLYGRGLCWRALDQNAKAIADFRRALGVPAPSDLAPRIRLVLIESLVDAEKLADARTVSAELLRDSRSGEAEFLRAKVLLLTLASPGGSSAQRKQYRREVIDCIARLEKRGGKWARLGRQLVSAGITRPEEWLDEASGSTIQWIVAESLRGRGKCGEAIPLYEKLVAGDSSPSPEVLLALGACHFEVQEYRSAYDVLSRVDLAKETGDAAADAAYLRFKAAEALEHGEPTPQAKAALEEAARAYLQAFPDHASAFEAHYRLAEIERDRGNLVAAIAEFDAVGGDSPFHLRAAFSAAQCSVERLEKDLAAGAKIDEALVRSSLERLRGFLADAAALREKAGRSAANEVMLAPMEAQARLLSALVLTSGRDPKELAEALATLDGFEARYTAQESLYSSVNAMRATAYLGLQRYAEAEAAVRALVESPTRSERDYRLMQQLGVRSLELAEERRKANDREAEQALRRQALLIYEDLLAASESGAIKGDPEGLRMLVSDLRAQQAKPGAAPRATERAVQP